MVHSRFGSRGCLPGLMMFGGFLCFVYNLWMTARTQVERTGELGYATA